MDIDAINNFIQNFISNNKLFNPDYLFSKMMAFLVQIPPFLKQINSMGLNLKNVVFVLNIALFFFVTFFLCIIFYCIIRMFEIRKKEHAHLHHEIEEYAHHMEEMKQKKAKVEDVSKNPRWVKTLEYVFSNHTSDWKLAIIEADSLLEDLMDSLGFKGVGVGEKLKNATQENFSKLTSAWEVHNIRNKIAHEGTSYEISQHEARRVIAIYEDIFREYGFI